MIVLALSVLLLVVLIIKKINPMIALLGVSLLTGLMYGMPVQKLLDSISKGIGSTLGSIIMVLALGAMIGKLAEESGAAQKLVMVLSRWFGLRHIQWAILITGLIAGIPLFYNAGFVILIPLVYALARSTKLPLLWVGLPMVAPLSVTHGFLPPHPGPVALGGIFRADIGLTILYGLIIAVPVAIAAGIVFPRMIMKKNTGENSEASWEQLDKTMPSTWKSFLILLLPVVLIAAGTAGGYFSSGTALQFFIFLQDPAVALLLSLLLTIIILNLPIIKAMDHCMEGVKAVAMIILIIAAAGAFKQVLIDSRLGDTIKTYTDSLAMSPLFLGWLIAAIFRVALGSATVAALTASSMVLPMLGSGVSPELMVLSVGAGSLMCSHVNDTGFWMFKEYFGLSVKETFKTWTVMESLISILGLAGVLVLDMFI